MVEKDYKKIKGSVTYARLLGDAVLKLIVLSEKDDG